MKQICWTLCALVLGSTSPVWAVHKCTDDRGKVTFQDAPCAEGAGEKIDVRPAMEGAKPIPPTISTATQGAFGDAWQRKHHLQTQLIPQARVAIERNQKDCNTPPEVVAHAGPLRRSTLASGTQFAQEQAAKAQQEKLACEARTQDLRNQLKRLEDELQGL